VVNNEKRADLGSGMEFYCVGVGNGGVVVSLAIDGELAFARDLRF